MIGKKHSSITDSATASLELHSTLWGSPRGHVSESSSVLWTRDQEKPPSSSCLAPRYFCKCSKSCRNNKSNSIKYIQKYQTKVYKLMRQTGRTIQTTTMSNITQKRKLTYIFIFLSKKDKIDVFMKHQKGQKIPCKMSTYTKPPN